MKFVVITALLSLVFSFSLKAFDHSHSSFDTLLRESVLFKGSKSYVKYSTVKKNPALLNSYIKKIQSVSVKEYESWSKNQKMAFLINAYNALTIKLILTKYPHVKSIKDLGGFFSSPWKKEFFTLFGKKRHLDYIEHELLRKKFKDARIHFAIVCASKSCPALMNYAYLPEKLDNQLEKSAELFIRDMERNRYNRDKNSLELSSIFKWFSEDFERERGSVSAFVAPYITEDKTVRKKIASGDVDISYLDYDWSLNRY